MQSKPETDYQSLSALDIRVGTILKAEDADTRKPTYRLTVDFGPEVGIKISCGAYRNYTKEELIGKQVIGIVNFPTKKMGPEKSEALVLGVPSSNGDTIYLTPASAVNLGAQVF
ncbi:MAG: protein secretion chaperonin CsaA [Patescibacteria group bacterium]